MSEDLIALTAVLVIAIFGLYSSHKTRKALRKSIQANGLKIIHRSIVTGKITAQWGSSEVRFNLRPGMIGWRNLALDKAIECTLFGQFGNHILIHHSSAVSLFISARMVLPPIKVTDDRLWELRFMVNQ
jgi:hypothetical protein